ncbi:MAG: Fic family protein [Candidatus Limnocylindrales bacterium]
MESGWFQEAMALVTDRRFAAIRRRAEHYPLTWDEFVLLPQPPGAAPAQVWDLLTALRRQTAVELPEYAVDTLGRRGWYSLTRSMRADLADIDRRCNRDSSLAESLRSNAATHFVVASHVNAALTAIGEDGVYLDHKRTNEVLLGERRPRTSEEQLLLNTHRVMWELEELADQRCTPQLIRSIHARVAENAPQRLPTPPGLDMGGWERIPLDADATLEYVSRFVNGEGVDPDDHPITYALGLLISFMSGRPLPSWNGLMSVLLTRLLFLRSRLPVVAMIPIARVYRAWQSGVIVPPVVPVALHDSLIPVGDEFDFTLYVATVIHLVRMELDATEAAIRRALASDQILTRAMAADRRVNHRQRGVLSAALSEPETVFRIDTHQRLYRVAYSTARADLLGLVDLGFLSQERRGSAFVFAPVAGFRQRVRDLAVNSPSGGSSKTK